MKNLAQQEIVKIRRRFIGASFFLLLAMMSLSIIWNRSIKAELAHQAAHFVRKGVLTTDMRGVRESLSGVQLTSFEVVSLYDTSGERIISFPSSLEYQAKMGSLAFYLLYESMRVPVLLDRYGDETLGVLEFCYSRFDLLKQAVGVWAIAAFGLWFFLSGAIKKVQKESEREIKIRNAETIEEMAKKVRHNIRSPLAVLKALVVEQSLESHDFFEQCRSAVLRLEEIVSEIRVDFQKNPEQQKLNGAIFEVSRIVERIVSEKRIVAGDIRLELKSSEGPLYSKIPAMELRATLSNLLDNALQSINDRGSIWVEIFADEFLIEVKIKDTGCGIPTDVIPKLFQKGFSYQKSQGTGLGLYFAKKLMDAYQGNIEIQSVLGGGSIVTLAIPRVQTPSWHFDRLDLRGKKSVIVCDDVPAIHKTWQMRFRGLGREVDATYLLDVESLSVSRAEAAICLFDLDLGKDQKSGLAFAESLEDRDNFILVTGNYDALEVQDACERLGCKLLPKDEIGQIQIVV